MNTSARMLRLLSLMQTHRFWPGGELSERLDVSPRTLRRDIDRLRELGYSVDAVRGVAGGYRLRAGGQLPPLLLEDEEAVAIAVALRTAASGTVAGGEETALQALTKIIALMSPRLRRQMDALQSQTDGVAAPWGAGPVVDAAVLTTLAQACRDDEPITFAYTARDSAATERRVEPHRLVSIGRRWYLVAFDRDRLDWRSFRVDRVTAPQTSGQRFRPRDLPADDAPAFVRAGIETMSHKYDVRVTVALDAATVTAHVGQWAEVISAADGCELRMSTDDLGWPVLLLAQLDGEFVVDSPPELRELIASAAARFARSARA